MVSYRMASKLDIEGIASLHAQSWQENYRGALSDDFLDNRALSDRMQVWNERLRNIGSEMHVIIAEHQREIVGFVCIFLKHSTRFGTLLDNLHVSSEMKGKGIGRRLVYLAAKAIDKRDPGSGMYLWVLEQNSRAINFYDMLGGEKMETVAEIDIGDRPVVKSRYYWKSVRSLIDG